MEKKDKNATTGQAPIHHPPREEMDEKTWVDEGSILMKKEINMFASIASSDIESTSPEMQEYLSFLMTGISLNQFSLDDANQFLYAWLTEEQKENFFQFLLKKQLVPTNTLAEIRKQVSSVQEKFEVFHNDGIPQIRMCVPEKIGKYAIKRKIGSGGMGTVYEATDTTLKRRVALKVLTEKGTDSSVARFLREARTLYMLSHPHIVPIYDLVSEGDMYYYAMAYIEGKNLEQMPFPIPYREACKIIAEVAETLHYAHQKKIVHRDIKPSNIIVDKDGKTWLMDFGLAKDLQEGKSLTHSGTILGTPFYMSPEQLDDPNSVDRRSDIYSLGAVLYQILSGKPPFYDKTIPKVFQKILFSDPEPLKNLNPEIPAGLAQICTIAMSRDREKRYSHASFMARDLRNIQKYDTFVPRKARVGKKQSQSALIKAGISIGLMIAVFCLCSFWDTEEKKPRQNPPHNPRQVTKTDNEDNPPKITNNTTVPVQPTKPADGNTTANIVPNHNQSIQAVEKARQEMSQGKMTAAMELLERAIQYDASNEQAYLTRAQIYLSMNNLTFALGDLNKVISLRPNIHQAYNLKGKTLLGMQKYQEAVDTFSKSLLICKCADCYNMRGLILCDYLGEYDKAIEDFKSALQMSPNYETAYHNLAIAYTKKREFQKALEFYDMILQRNPFSTQDYIARGALYCDCLQQYEKALNDFEHAISLQPKSYAAHCNRAIVLARLNDHRKAVEACNQAIAIDSTQPKAYYLCGVSWYMLKNSYKALENFSKVMTLSSSSYHQDAQNWISKIKQETERKK